MLAFLLAVATTPLEIRAQQSAPAGSGQPAPLSVEELQKITAPIALYPDALVAQILGPRRFQTRLRSPPTGFTRTTV